MKKQRLAHTEVRMDRYNRNFRNRSINTNLLAQLVYLTRELKMKPFLKTSKLKISHK